MMESIWKSDLTAETRKVGQVWRQIQQVQFFFWRWVHQVNPLEMLEKKSVDQKKNNDERTVIVP